MMSMSGIKGCANTRGEIIPITISQQEETIPPGFVQIPGRQIRAGKLTVIRNGLVRKLPTGANWTGQGRKSSPGKGLQPLTGVPVLLSAPINRITALNHPRGLLPK